MTDERSAMHARVIEALAPMAARVEFFYRKHVDDSPVVGWYIMWCHVCDVGAGRGKKETPERRELFSLFAEAIVGSTVRSRSS